MNKPFSANVDYKFAIRRRGQAFSLVTAMLSAVPRLCGTPNLHELSYIIVLYKYNDSRQDTCSSVLSASQRVFFVPDNASRSCTVGYIRFEQCIGFTFEFAVFPFRANVNENPRSKSRKSY